VIKKKGIKEDEQCYLIDAENSEETKKKKDDDDDDAQDEEN
jgi:hypothetical protein